MEEKESGGGVKDQSEVEKLLEELMEISDESAWTTQGGKQWRMKKKGSGDEEQGPENI